MGSHRAPARRGRSLRLRHVLVGGVAAGIIAVLVHPIFPTFGHSAGATDSPDPLAATGTPGPTTTGPLDPKHFAPGACVALPPTHNDTHQTVFLDAGHGGADPGASGNTGGGNSVNEKTVTLPVALDAATQLRAAGYRVVLSRTSDESVSKLGDGDLTGEVLTTRGEHAGLMARVHCANLSTAAALVSIHFDAYDDPSARGTTTLYDPDRPFAADNQALATQLQQHVLAALNSGGWSVPDRGIATDDTGGGGEITPQGTAYGHLDLLGPADPGYLDSPTPMPGALIEPLFLTNPTDADIVTDPTGQHAIATGITQALQAFLTKH